MSKLLPIAFIASSLALAACSGAADDDKAAATAGDQSTRLAVTDAVVKVGADAAAPSAAYFTVHGGPEATKLIGVISSDAERVEMHESKMDNGVMAMNAVQTVDVPAGGEVKFRQGGLHAMVFGIKERARAAGKLQITLMFEGGRALAIEAPLTSVTGAPVAASDGEAPMDHMADH